MQIGNVVDIEHPCENRKRRAAFRMTKHNKTKEAGGRKNRRSRLGHFGQSRGRPREACPLIPFAVLFVCVLLTLLSPSGLYAHVISLVLFLFVLGRWLLFVVVVLGRLEWWSLLFFFFFFFFFFLFPDRVAFSFLACLLLHYILHVRQTQ